MEKIIKITVTIFLSGILLMLVISACGDKSSSSSSPDPAPSTNNDPDTDNDQDNPTSTVVNEAEYPEYCSSTTTEVLGQTEFNDGGEEDLDYTDDDTWVTAQHEGNKWIGWSQNKLDDNRVLSFSLSLNNYTTALAKELQAYDANYRNYFLTEDLVFDDDDEFLNGYLFPFSSDDRVDDSAGPGAGIFDGCGHTITFRYSSDFTIFHTNCDPCVYRNIVFDFSGLVFDVNTGNKNSESNLFIGRDITLENVGILNKKLIRTYNETALNGRTASSETNQDGLEFYPQSRPIKLTVKNSFIHIDGIADPYPLIGNNDDSQGVPFFAPFFADQATFENVIFVYDTDRTIDHYRYASPILKNNSFFDRKARFPDDTNKSANLKNIITIGKVVFNAKQDDFSYNGIPIFGFSEYAISPGLFSKFNGTYENIFYDSKYHFTYPDNFNEEKYVTAAGYDRNWIDDQANAEILYPQYKIDSPDRYLQDPAKPADPENERNTIDNRDSLWGFNNDVNWHYKDGEYPVLNGHPLSVERQREIINAARN